MCRTIGNQNLSWQLGSGNYLVIQKCKAGRFANTRLELQGGWDRPATTRATTQGRTLKGWIKGNNQERHHSGWIQSACVAGDLPNEAELSDLANGWKGGFQRREWKERLWIWKSKNTNAEPSNWDQKRVTEVPVHVVANKTITKDGDQAQISQLNTVGST